MMKTDMENNPRDILYFYRARTQGLSSADHGPSESTASSKVVYWYFSGGFQTNILG